VNKKGKIIFYCMIFVGAKAFSQNLYNSPAKVQLLVAIKNTGKVFPLADTVQLHLPVTKPIIRADYYVKHLGFFCRQEIKLEKITNVPFRFRLGTVEDCDRMEGKLRRY
jgi:hypothetical protein